LGQNNSGNNTFKHKVEDYVKHLQLLSNYAQDDPQATYSAFTKG